VFPIRGRSYGAKLINVKLDISPIGSFLLVR
jgi:hypothetical protein